MVNVLSIFTVLLVPALSAAAGNHARGDSGDAAAHRRAADIYNAAAAAPHFEGTTLPNNGTRNNTTDRCRPRPSSSSLRLAHNQTSTTSLAETTSSSAPLVNKGDSPTRSTPQPQHTTSHKEIPITTTHHTTHKMTTSTKPKAAATTTKSPSSGSGASWLSGTHNGQGTWYGVGEGACGRNNDNTQMVAAASHILYDNYPGATANPNNNPICGRTATAHYGDQSVTFTFVDRCVGCAEWDVDFSPACFSQLTNGNLGLGRMNIWWEFD